MLAFELAAILDVVPFGEIDALIDHFPDIVDRSSQVAPGNVGRDHDPSSHVFPVDRVGAGSGGYFGDVPQRDFLSVGIHDQSLDPFRCLPAVVVYLQRQVERLVPFVYLGDYLAREHHVHDLGEIRKCDSILGHQFPLWLDRELGALYLLLHVEIGNPFDPFDVRLDGVSQFKHPVQVAPEQLDGDVGLSAR